MGLFDYVSCQYPTGIDKIRHKGCAMTGRILRGLTIFSFTWWVMWPEITIPALITAALAWFFAEPSLDLIRNRIKEWQRKRLFGIAFVDRPPPGEQEMDMGNPHPIPVGQSQHMLRIRPSESIKLGVFNLRFLDTEELSSDHRVDIRHIISISHVECMPSLLLEGLRKFRNVDDECGGRNVILEPPIDIAANEPFTLRVNVTAENQQWYGKISFRAPDPEGNRRLARTNVMIDNTAR